MVDMPYAHLRNIKESKIEKTGERQRGRERGKQGQRPVKLCDVCQSEGYKIHTSSQRILFFMISVSNLLIYSGARIRNQTWNYFIQLPFCFWSMYEWMYLLHLPRGGLLKDSKRTRPFSLARLILYNWVIYSCHKIKKNYDSNAQLK